MTDEKELRHRTNEIAKLMASDSWAFIESEWFVERERIIRLGREAVEKREIENAAFFMAELAGFDRALQVPQEFQRQKESFLASDKEDKNVDEEK